MEEHEAKTLGRQLMEISGAAYLTTIQPDGYPNTRALENLRNRRRYNRFFPFFNNHKDDYLILFSTHTSSNKVSHILDNPKVSVYYCDPSDSRGLTLTGDAVIEEGMEIKETIWDPQWSFHYPGGFTDPDSTIISLKPKKARYYHRLDRCEFNL